MVARVHSFSNISCVQNDALADAEFVCAGFNQRKSNASTARSFAIQDLPVLTLLAGLMRITEPNGVRVAELAQERSILERYSFGHAVPQQDARALILAGFQARQVSTFRNCQFHIFYGHFVGREWE
jgi:hypothetical protein